MNGWERLRIFDLTEERACVLDPAGPAWLLVQRDAADRLRRWQQGAILEPADSSHLADELAAIARPTALNAPVGQPQKQLYIELLNACNLRCSHCYNHSGDPTRPRYKLDYDMLIRLFDEAVDMGVSSVTFSGGEPLMRRDLFDLIAAARERKFLVKIVTNGTLITPAKAEKLAASGAYLDMSLEGATAETHDRLRGAGSFEKSMRGLDNLRAAGGVPYLIFSMVMNRANRHELDAMVALCRRHGVAMLQVLFLTYQGRAIGAWDDLHLSRGEVGELCTEVFDLQQALSGEIVVENEVVSTALKALIFGGRAGNYSCSVGSQYRIDYAGNVHPCAFFDNPRYAYGNLAQAGSLRAALVQAAPIVQDLSRALYHRAENVEQVAQCAWRGYCGGGCMADASHRGGSIWGVGKLCCDIREKLFLHILRKMAGAREAAHAAT
jgi:radical SAM protein with 4Fe4S-binding SPASM domain